MMPPKKLLKKHSQEQNNPVTYQIYTNNMTKQNAMQTFKSDYLDTIEEYPHKKVDYDAVKKGSKANPRSYLKS